MCLSRQADRQTDRHRQNTQTTHTHHIHTHTHAHCSQAHTHTHTHKFMCMHVCVRVCEIHCNCTLIMYINLINSLKAEQVCITEHEWLLCSPISLGLKCRSANQSIGIISTKKSTTYRLCTDYVSRICSV